MMRPWSTEIASPIVALGIVLTGLLTSSTAADPAAALTHARAVMGFDRVNGRVIHYRAVTAEDQTYQSDRTYPPTFSAMHDQEIWLDPSAKLLRIRSTTTFPGSADLASVTLDDGEHAAILRNDQPTPISRRQAKSRGLSAWAVVADWSSASGIRAVGSEVYRDYPRLVLGRSTPRGEERLFLDEKSGFPVKLELTEPHYLWGQYKVEYVWSNWSIQGPIVVPGAAFRLVDGAIEMSQTVGTAELIQQDAAPAMATPAAPAQPPPDLPGFLQAIPPTRTRIGPNTWLLTNPGYTEAVTLVGDEVFVFDATQSEERARQDAEAIASLFPGRHKINVVVTDLAWPHIGGVRYWVSQGATIIAHRAARTYLQKVIDRRWTLAPDSLEQKRKTDPGVVHLDFVAIDRPYSAADGAVRMMPIDGIGSEIALMAYLPADRFLWASDYIQTLDGPSQYATEVVRAVERAGLAPERTAAQHRPLTDWKTVVEKNPAGTRSPARQNAGLGGAALAQGFANQRCRPCRRGSRDLKNAIRESATSSCFFSARSRALLAVAR